MLVLKYLLMLTGVGLFGSAAALVAYDIYISSQLRRLLRREMKKRGCLRRACEPFPDLASEGVSAL